MELVRPSAALLTSYADALERGWSPDNMREAAAARGVLVERFARPPQFGSAPGFRYRIDLG